MRRACGSYMPRPGELLLARMRYQGLFSEHEQACPKSSTPTMAPIKSKPRTEKPKTKHNGIAKRKPESKSKQKSSVPKKNTLKKRKTYTDEELGIPKLNMITPAGVQKPRGKKKGKIFVDDQESMMTILAMVNADKEGQIESKMMRAVSQHRPSTPIAKEVV